MGSVARAALLSFLLAALPAAPADAQSALPTIRVVRDSAGQRLQALRRQMRGDVSAA